MERVVLLARVRIQILLRVVVLHLEVWKVKLVNIFGPVELFEERIGCGLVLFLEINQLLDVVLHHLHGLVEGLRADDGNDGHRH